MDKCLLNFLIVIFTGALYSSCERSSVEINASLRFSEDTIHFDTVFTSIGSTTRELKVFNTGKRDITIDEICLSGGPASSFRININGEPGCSAQNIQIEGGDSIFIFVDVIIDPLNIDAPVAVTDSIMFSLSGSSLCVYLLAWGQDIHLLNNEIIESETWTSHKPYVIYGSVLVDTLETLTVEEGTRIYFHKNSSLSIAGNVFVNGSFENPVLFVSDRLEKMYEDVPGQWLGIFIKETSSGNNISHARIRNSVFGLSSGEETYDGKATSLKLLWTEISHSTVNGLSAVNSNIEAANCLFYHCGSHCISIASGGEYSFTHCTVYNQWDYGYRMTPSVSISEKPVSPGGIATLMNVDLINSIISGDMISEIGIEPVSSGFSGYYFFDHCLLKLDTLTAGFWQKEQSPGTLINNDPRFIDKFKYDFRPDTLSPLIDKGNDLYITSYQLDFRAVSRNDDGKPDIGAFERIIGEKGKHASR